MSRDEIYAREEIGGRFEFSEGVVEVFEDMIRRSVPGYGLTLEAIQAVAGREVQEGTRVYDLGCSLGAGIGAVRRGILIGASSRDAEAQSLLDLGVEVVGVDSSAAMVEQARGLVGDWEGVEIFEGDAVRWPLSGASLVVLNFTLQFVPVGEREGFLRRCWEGLVPGGVLFLSEKFVSGDEEDEEWLRELHWEFKRQQGYSELEIARKREALEEVLVPELLEVHEERLRGVGFGRVTRVLQGLNFASWVGRK